MSLSDLASRLWPYFRERVEAMIRGNAARQGSATVTLNGSVITITGNITLAGGGTLNLNGFTLTIPATGTAALLGAANVFTANQQISKATPQFLLTPQNNNQFVIMEMGDGATFGWQVGKDVNSGTLATANGFYIYSWVGGAVALAITTGGNVLIGTLTNEGKLVLGTATARLAFVDATTVGSTKASPGTVDSWLEIKVGGNTRYVAAYSSKTS